MYLQEWIYWRWKDLHRFEKIVILNFAANKTMHGTRLFSSHRITVSVFLQCLFVFYNVCLFFTMFVCFLQCLFVFYDVCFFFTMFVCFLLKLRCFEIQEVN